MRALTPLAALIGPVMMKKVLIATTNPGKVREMAAMLAEADMVAVTPQDLSLELGSIEETGLTFIENALIKARHASRCAGLPAIADDSGLEVDLLNGRPGIFSARFAGMDASDEDNNACLLKALSRFDDPSPKARFRCVIVLLRHPEDQSPLIAEGTWEGVLLRQPRGQGGFGYDGLFEVPGRGLTAAELSAEEKNERSHRGQALRSLMDQLRVRPLE